MTLLPQAVAGGDADFLLEAAVSDLAAYKSLLLGHISRVTAVSDARSTFALRTASVSPRSISI